MLTDKPKWLNIMLMKHVLPKIYLLFLLAILALFPRITYACGCGLALTDSKVFNALKETQAYLLVDVKSENSYIERPFFRMISMDKPYDVTLVYPMKDIPSNVTGEKITASEFLNKYNINNAEDNFKNQKISTFIKKVTQSLYSWSNGLFVKFLNVLSGSLIGGSSIPSDKQTGMAFGPVAHFDFEGGKLDVYDIKGGNKLSDFIKTIKTPLSDDVIKTINRYKDYYVAVLTLNVPSVVSTSDLNTLKRCVPTGLENIKHLLSIKTEFKESEIYNLETKVKSLNSCGLYIDPIIEKYINNALFAESLVEGVLVNMEYRNNSSFFYPTSIVNTYKYPIIDQRYYVKVPDKLGVKFNSGKNIEVANINNERWYKTKSTSNDLSGNIVRANVIDKSGDRIRSVILLLNTLEGFVSLSVLLLWFIVFIAPFIALRKIYNLKFNGLIGYFIAYVLGGLVLTSLIFLLNRKRKLALTYISIWVLLLLSTIYINKEQSKSNPSFGRDANTIQRNVVRF